MRFVMHQALKDIWLFRWLLLAWLVLLAALHVLVLSGIGIPPETSYGVYLPGGRDTLSTTFDVLCALIVGGLVAITVLVMQSDPGVGTTAFWFTRPISARTVLVAKLAVLLSVFAVLPVVVDGLVLLSSGIALRAALSATLTGLGIQVAWLLPVMALAAFTNGLAQFVLAALSEVIAILCLTWITRTIGNPGGPGYPSGYAGIWIAMLLIAAIVTLVYAYASRSVRGSYVVAAVAPVFITVVASVATPNAMPRSAVETPSPIRVSVQSNPITITRAADGSCTFDAYFVVSDVPAHEAVTGVRADASIVASGTRVKLLASTGGVAPVPDALITTAMGGSRVVAPNVDRSNAAGRPLALRGYGPPGRCTALHDGFGHLEVNITLESSRYRAKEVDLAVGTRFPAAAGWGKVLALQPTAVGLQITLQSVGTETDLISAMRTTLYAAYNPRRNELLSDYRNSTRSGRFGTTVIPVPQHLSSRFDQVQVGSLPGFNPDTWLRGAKLVVVTASEHQTVERRVDIGEVPIVAKR